MNKNPLPFPLEYLFICIVLLVAIGIFFMYLVESKKRYEKFMNSKPQFLMFFTNWCGHSRKMKPIFDEVKNELVTVDKVKNEKKTLKEIVDFKMINCENDDTRICSLFKIKYLPTLILIKNGKKIKYTGGPELEKLYLFLKREAIQN